MKKHPLLTLRLAGVLAVFWLLSLMSIAACTGVAVPGGSDPEVASPGEGPGPVIGSEQTERYHNVDLTVTAQALAAGVPPNLPSLWTRSTLYSTAGDVSAQTMQTYIERQSKQ
jgi:hypothetical protein